MASEPIAKRIRMRSNSTCVDVTAALTSGYPLTTADPMNFATAGLSSLMTELIST